MKKHPTFTCDQIQWLEDKLFQRLSIACLALGNLKKTLQEVRAEVERLRKDGCICEKSNGEGDKTT